MQPLLNKSSAKVTEVWNLFRSIEEMVSKPSFATPQVMLKLRNELGFQDSKNIPLRPQSKAEKFLSQRSQHRWRRIAVEFVLARNPEGGGFVPSSPQLRLGQMRCFTSILWTGFLFFPPGPHDSGLPTNQTLRDDASPRKSRWHACDYCPTRIEFMGRVEPSLDELCPLAQDPFQLDFTPAHLPLCPLR